MPDGPEKTIEKQVSCLSCRHRKIKCGREPDGCSNCSRAEIPCIYQLPETGVKRKRGPYKKNGLVRERELAHMLRAVEAKKDHTANQSGDHHTNLSEAKGRASTLHQANLHPAKDGIFSSMAGDVSSPQTVSTASTVSSSTSRNAHPPFEHIIELWHLYTVNFDPVAKLLHCPSFLGTLIDMKTTTQKPSDGLEALVLSVYYAAVASTPAEDIQRRFSMNKDELLARYKTVFERQLATASATNCADISTLQALVHLLVCLHRKDQSSIHWTMFALATRIAQQLLDVQEMSIFDTQMLRRAWWTLCRVESRTTEEMNARPFGAIDWDLVPRPLNLNDIDLDPAAKAVPQSRTGITDMTFCLISFELKRLASAVSKVFAPDHEDLDENEETKLISEKLRLIQESESTIDAQILQHCHDSRPMDWMCVVISRIMLAKLRLLAKSSNLNHSGKEPYFTDLEKLNSSLEILRLTHALHTDPRIRHWIWYFRDFVQWHALTFVLSEFCKQPWGALAEKTWLVLDPILSQWESRPKQLGPPEFLEPVTKLINRTRRRMNQPSARRVEGVAAERSTSTLKNHPPSSMNTNQASGSAFTVEVDGEPQPASVSSGLQLEQQNEVTFPTGGSLDNTSITGTSTDLSYDIDLDLPTDFDDTLIDFDWNSWADVAQNMDFEFGFV